MSASPDRTIVLTSLALRTLKTTILKPTENLILWHLVATLPPMGDAVSNVQLGRELSIISQHITPIMRRLCELGFLMRGPKVGLSYHYKLNPAFFRILS